MKLLDKNKEPIRIGLYRGEGSKIDGPVLIEYVYGIHKETASVQTMNGFSHYSQDRLSGLERIDNPIEFLELAEYSHSPSSRVVQFLKSVLWDCAKPSNSH